MNPNALHGLAGIQPGLTPAGDANPSTRWSGLQTVGAKAPDTAAYNAPRDIETREQHAAAGCSVQVAETIGMRPQQEDAFCITTTPPQSPEQAAAFLKDTFAHINNQTRNNNAGSTCTVATVSNQNQLTLAHLGDSPATVFVLDGDTREVHYRALLTDHNHQNPTERARLEDLRDNKGVELDFYGHHVYTEAGGLAVTRAFGDAVHDEWLTRDPEITQVDLNGLLPGLKATDRVFLCVSCDGLVENARDDSNVYEGLADALRRAALNGGHDLAGALVEQAYRRSTDNITAMVVELPPAGRAGQPDLVLALADGHGGSRTAHQAIENLKEVCQQAWNNAPSQPAPALPASPRGPAFDASAQTARASSDALLQNTVKLLITFPHMQTQPIAQRTVLAAASQGDQATLETLARAGVNLEVKNEAGQTALARALATGDVLAANTLLRARAAQPAAPQSPRQPEPIENMLRLARDKKSAAALEGAVSLLEVRPDQHTSSVARAVIRMVAESGRVDLLRKLTQAGVDLDQTGHNNQTPLSGAILSVNAVAVSTLLAGGADVMLRGRNDFTPLHLAARQGKHLVIDVLIAAGADPNAKGRSPGGTPLTPIDIAKLFEHPDCFSALRKNILHRPTNHWDSQPHRERDRADIAAMLGRQD